MDVMRWKRASVALLLLPVVLAGCGGGEQTTSEPPPLKPVILVSHVPPLLAYGWKLVSIDNEGFALEIPPDWEELDLSQFDLKAGMSQVAEANPSIADAISGEVAAMVTKGIKLFAVDNSSNIEATGFATNLNLLKEDAPTGMSLDDVANQSVAELKKELNIDGSLQVMRNRININAGEAERLQYSWNMSLPNGTTREMAFTQYMAISGTNAYILTFTTTEDQSAIYSALFEQIAMTLTILPAK